jgi:hypothetical protein
MDEIVGEFELKQTFVRTKHATTQLIRMESNIRDIIAIKTMLFSGQKPENFSLLTNFLLQKKSAKRPDIIFCHKIEVFI